MADRALIFADGGDAYTFPNMQTFNPAFANAVNATSRVVGASGGVDYYGGEDAPDSIASLRATFYLQSDTEAGMQALRDEVAALKTLGAQKLYWQPQGSLEQRWCYAKVDRVGMNQAWRDTEFWQLVTINFHVAEPRWYHDQESQAINASGTSTDGTITNAGNTPALARVVMAPGVGDSCENPAVRRIVSAVTVDEMQYIGTLTNGDTLILDAEEKSAELNSASVFGDIDVQNWPHWFWLLPGSNTVRVIFSNPGDAAAVTVYWKDTFR